MNITELAYELYKIDWMRRISAEHQMDVFKNFYQNQEGQEDSEYTIKDWIEDEGYDGELYVCKDEFLDTEYLDKEYMKSLFDNDTLFKEYQANFIKKWYNIELNQKDAEKLHRHLYNIGVHFDTSGCFNLVHFEIELSPDESTQLDAWINSNLLDDIITNK